VSCFHPAATPDKLVSGLLLDDPDMYDLVEEFVDGLTGRLAEFRQAYQRLDWDNLTRLAHQLKGAGGSFGYPDLSSLAATMERAFRLHSGNEFASWIKRLERLIGAARAGLQHDD